MLQYTFNRLRKQASHHQSKINQEETKGKNDRAKPQEK